MRKRLTSALVAVTGTLMLGLTGCAGTDPQDLEAQPRPVQTQRAQPRSVQTQPTQTRSVEKQSAPPRLVKTQTDSSPSKVGSLGDCSADTDINDPRDVGWAMKYAVYSETITVTNSSHFPLYYAGIDNKSSVIGHFLNAPVDIKPGQSAKITYCSNNLSGGYVHMYYASTNAIDKIDALFQIPVALNNQWVCSTDTQDLIASSYSRMCGESKGTYHAEFWWNIKTNTATASFPDLTAKDPWTFHLYGQPFNLTVGGNGDNGDPVSFEVYTDPKNPAAAWTWIKKDGDWGMLKNNKTGKCLEQNGTNGNVDTWDCVGSDNELWRPTNDGRFLQLASTKAWLGGGPGKPAVMQKQGQNLTALAAY